MKKNQSLDSHLQLYKIKLCQVNELTEVSQTPLEFMSLGCYGYLGMTQKCRHRAT